MTGYFVECLSCEYKEHFLSLFMASQDANNHANGYGHRNVRVYGDSDNLQYTAALEEGI